MKVLVLRKWFTEKSTVSDVLIEGSWAAFGLEDRIRGPGVKVKGQTAIPTGIYRLTIDMSTRFRRLMPHVLNVPMFDGIRIHAGNTHADTEGCLLVGALRLEDRVGVSRATYDAIFDDLCSGLTPESTIEYVNVDPPPGLLV